MFLKIVCNLRDFFRGKGLGFRPLSELGEGFTNDRSSKSNPFLFVALLISQKEWEVQKLLDPQKARLVIRTQCSERLELTDTTK